MHTSLQAGRTALPSTLWTHQSLLVCCRNVACEGEEAGLPVWKRLSLVVWPTIAAVCAKVAVDEDLHWVGLGGIDAAVVANPIVCLHGRCCGHACAA